MSDPIDLDLVEMRCRLRGWTLIYRDAKEIRVIVPERPGYAGAVITTKGGVDVHETGTESARSLTAPRWTLERLLSEPPEGWRVMDYGVTKTLLWGQPCVWGEDEWSDCEVIATLMVSKDFGCVAAKTSVAPSVGPENLARLAERHKAAADLALILAEVEP